MLSIELIRRDPEFVRQALASRGEDQTLEELLELDAQRRQASSRGDELRARRNQVSREIGQLRSSGQDAPPAVGQQMREVGQQIDALEQESHSLEERIHAILMELPNLPRPNVPPGLSEEANVVVRQWGEPHTPEFTPKPHWDLAEELGIIDFQRGVKLSGSRFYTMSGYGAQAGAGSHRLDAGLAYPGTRLYRVDAAYSGAAGDNGRVGEPAQVRR